MVHLEQKKNFKIFQTQSAKFGRGGQHNFVNDQTFELYFFITSLRKDDIYNPIKNLDNYMSYMDISIFTSTHIIDKSVEGNFYVYKVSSNIT